MSAPKRLLFALLLALSLIYLLWFWREPLARIIFVLPPAACALGLWLRRPAAGFFSGVLALGWFSHGVMVAWTRPPERSLALAAVLLAVGIVLTASLPGLHARRQLKKTQSGRTPGTGSPV